MQAPLTCGRLKFSFGVGEALAFGGWDIYISLFFKDLGSNASRSIYKGDSPASSPSAGHSDYSLWVSGAVPKPQSWGGE